MAGVYVRGIWAKRLEKIILTRQKAGPDTRLFFVFEVTAAGGEAMGGLHRGARAPSRAH